MHSTRIPVSRRTFIKASAAMAAFAAGSRLSGAFAEEAALNILNSNVAWSNALTGSVAEAYSGARITGIRWCNSVIAPCACVVTIVNEPDDASAAAISGVVASQSPANATSGPPGASAP